MSPHVPDINGRSQLSLFFGQAQKTLASAMQRAGSLECDEADLAALTCRLEDLQILLHTVEVFACNFEQAVAEMIGAVCLDADIEASKAALLLQPCNRILGDWYVHSTMEAASTNTPFSAAD